MTRKKSLCRPVWVDGQSLNKEVYDSQTTGMLYWGVPSFELLFGLMKPLLRKKKLQAYSLVTDGSNSLNGNERIGEVETPTQCVDGQHWKQQEA